MDHAGLLMDAFAPGRRSKRVAGCADAPAAAGRQCDHREYSSTISDSLISAPNSSRSGTFLKTPSILVASTFTQAAQAHRLGQLQRVRTRSCFLDFSRSATTSPAFTE
jgi:hypothetical protein